MTLLGGELQNGYGENRGDAKTMSGRAPVHVVHQDSVRTALKCKLKRFRFSLM